MQPLLKPGDVAKMLNVSERKAYSLKDDIGYVAVGGNVRFEEAAVLAYIDRCKRGSQQKGKIWESRHDTEKREAFGSLQKPVTANAINGLLKGKSKRVSTLQGVTRN